jgi:hypothetical protein
MSVSIFLIEIFTDFFMLYLNFIINFHVSTLFTSNINTVKHYFVKTNNIDGFKRMFANCLQMNFYSNKKGVTICRNSLIINLLNRASSRDQTNDLLITSQLLYQLSYGGKLYQLLKSLKINFSLPLL